MKKLYLFMTFLVIVLTGVLHAQCTTPVTIPFTETFDNGALPTCWISQNPTTTGTSANINWKFTGSASWGADTSANGRPAGTYAWVDASTPNLGVHDVELITPFINLTGLTVPFVQFDWFKNNEDVGNSDDNKLSVSVNDGNGWVQIFTSSANAPDWRTEGVVLNNTYVNAMIQVRFSVDKDVAGNGDFYDDLLLDDVKVSEAPTCFTPSNIVSSNPTTTTVDLTWTAPTSAPALGYEIYYNTTNVAPDAATTPLVTGITATSATVNGLSPSSTYYIWVRSKCTASDSSDWVAGTSFTTNCVVFNIPYFENFDTTTTGSSTNNTVPNCWSYLETSGSAGYGYVSSNTNNYSSPNSFYMNNSSDITGNIMLVTPETTNLSSGTNRVRFFAKGTSANYPIEIGTLSNSLDPTTFTIIGSPIILTTTQTEYTVDIPAGTNVYLAFKHGMNSSSDVIYIDDINVEAIPTCMRPTDLLVNTVTATTADVSWTASVSTPANGYEVYYSTSNTAPTATTVLDATNSVTSTSTSVTIAGLSASTTYYVWVRAVCGVTDSSYWSIEKSFITNCLAFNVPYFENFDTTSTGSSSNNNTPTCWRYLETTGSAGYGYVSSSSNNNSSPNSFYMNNSSDVSGDIMLVSPETTNLSSGTNRVRFFAKGTVNGYPIEIGTLSNPLDPTTFTIIGSPVSLTTTQMEYTVNIPAGTDAYVAFRHGMNSSSDVIYIDDINIEAIPTCVKPTDLLVNSVTTTTADVSWMASPSAPANGYEIYYDTSNTAPIASTIPQVTNITGTSTTIPGLSPATTYYFWVRAVCSPTDSSIWSIEQTFTTNCVAFTAPFTGSFSSGSQPNCWTNQNAQNSTNAQTFWKFDGSPSYGAATSANGKPVGTYAWVDASTDNAGIHNVELISPPIDLSPLTAPMIQFEWFKNHLTSTGGTTVPSADNNELSVHINNGAGWVELWSNDSNDPNWRTVMITIPPAYIGTTVQIMFSVDKDVAGNGDYYDDLLLDEIMVIQNTLSTTDFVKEDLKVYPNPFQDFIRISDVKDVVSISIVDLSGRLVKTIKPAREINLGDLKTGMYLINLKMKDGSVQTVKAIKK